MLYFLAFYFIIHFVFVFFVFFFINIHVYIFYIIVMKLKGVTWWTRIKPVKATTTQLSIDSGLPENKEDGQENKIDEQGKKE